MARGRDDRTPTGVFQAGQQEAALAKAIVPQVRGIVQEKIRPSMSHRQRSAFPIGAGARHLFLSGVDLEGRLGAHRGLAHIEASAEHLTRPQSEIRPPAKASI